MLYLQHPTLSDPIARHGSTSPWLSDLQLAHLNNQTGPKGEELVVVFCRLPHSSCMFPVLMPHSRGLLHALPSGHGVPCLTSGRQA